MARFANTTIKKMRCFVSLSSICDTFFVYVWWMYSQILYLCLKFKKMFKNFNWSKFIIEVVKLLLAGFAGSQIS